MKRLVAIFLLLFVVSTTQAQTNEREQVNALHKKKFIWLVEQQLDSLRSLLDENAQYIHSNGWIQAKQDVISDFQSGKLKYTAVEVQASDVRLYGQMAIVVGKGLFKGALNATEFSMNLTYTEVYVKLMGRWKLVSRHSCKI